MPVRKIACGQLEARDLEHAERALTEACEMVAAAGAVGADLCVLPEGTWPAYVLGSAEAARATMTAGPDAAEVLGASARRAGVELVVGLVTDTPAGLVNEAVHFGRDGAVRARAAKRFLWHVDRSWFVPGAESRPRDGVGMLVCADGRLPEISGGLVAHGARLLANPTAWVCSEPPPAGTNPQAEFLWRVRALENGVPAAAATKVGTEGGVAIYSGGSQVVDASGHVLIRASATTAELVVATVEVPDAPHPARRPAAAPARPGPLPPSREGHAYVVVLTDGADLSDAAKPADRAIGVVCAGADLVCGPEGIVAAGNVRCVELLDDEMLTPDAARAAALAGAEVVTWTARAVSTPYVEEVARARALENRVFVAMWRPAKDGGPLIVSPAGRVLARAPAGVAPFAVGALCLLAEAASKQMAPGTDLWLGVRDLTGPTATSTASPASPTSPNWST